MKIGKNIKYYRNKLKMTQDQLAEKLHTSRQTISSYETGRTHADVETLAHIADIFNISLIQLLYGEEEQASKYLRYAALTVLTFILLAWLAISISIYIEDNYILSNTGLPKQNSVPVTNENQASFKVLFAICDVWDKAEFIISILFRFALTILLCCDLYFKGKKKINRRLLLFAALFFGRLAVTLPWVYISNSYGLGNYIRLSASNCIIFAAKVLIIDIAFITGSRLYRKHKFKKEPIHKP